MCAEAPKWEKNMTWRRNQVEAGVVESRGRRRVWGEAAGVGGAEVEVLLAVLGGYTIWGREIHLGPTPLDMHQCGPSLWAAQACPALC